MEAVGALATSITEVLSMHGLPAVFVVLLLKGIGIPLPIPGELVLLFAATQMASGSYGPGETAAALIVAMVGGGSLQYLGARELGRPLLSRYAGLVGGEGRWDRAAASVEKAGPLALCFLMLTPGLGAATIPAAGLARLPFRTFLPGLAGASAISLAAHLGIGFAAVQMATVVPPSLDLTALPFAVACLASGLVALP